MAVPNQPGVLRTAGHSTGVIRQLPTWRPFGERATDMESLHKGFGTLPSGKPMQSTKQLFPKLYAAQPSFRNDLLARMGYTGEFKFDDPATPVMRKGMPKQVPGEKVFLNRHAGEALRIARIIRKASER